MVKQRDTTDKASRLDAALQLTAAGFHVFPLHHVVDGACSCSKGKKCDNGAGKHPRAKGWQEQATTEADKVRALWKKYPLANPGIATGEGRGVWVVGPDGEEGRADLAGLEREHGELPQTPTAETGSGGEHRFFRWPAGLKITNARNHRGLKIDIRGEGGLVVGAGSRNRNGPYRWKGGLAPADVALADAPDWLLQWAGAELGLDEDENSDEDGQAPQSEPLFEMRTGGHSIEERARAYLDRCPAAISGQGGHATTLWVARCLVLGFDLGCDRSFELLRDCYNGRCNPPWTEKELLHKVKEADEKPFGKPRGWLLNGRRTSSTSGPSSTSMNGTPVPSEPVDNTCVEAGPAPEHRTDLGNARRLVRWHGIDLRHCHPWGKWLAWDGQRWRVDDTAEVMRRAKQTVRRMFDEAAAEIKALREQGDEDDERIKQRLATAMKMLAWAVVSESATRLTALVGLARSEPGIPILPAVLDAHLWLLNVENGTLDLRTGELRPHQREDLLTCLCPTLYEPKAVCPAWERFLREVFANDEALVVYMQRSLGRCLSGDVSEHHLPIAWGCGANGKSTLFNAMLDVMGDDYATKANADLLLVSKSERHPTEVANLFGRRLVVAAESDQGRRLNEALIKELTGGDQLSARRMREDFWKFSPTHKLFLCTNHKPVVRGTDYAMWRRLRLVPFTQVFRDPAECGEEEVCLVADKQLPEKLRRERTGILAWLVRGCLDWQREGLPLPDRVREATREYRQAEDLLLSWISECCVTGDSSYRRRASELYASFKKWCELGNERAISSKVFGDAMTERGFERYTNNGTWYLGITLRDCGQEG